MSRAARPRPPRRRRPIIVLVLAALAAVLVGSTGGAAAAAVAVAIGDDDTGVDSSLRVSLDPVSPVAGEPVTVVVHGTSTGATVQCFVDGRPLVTESAESAEPGGPAELRLAAVMPAEAAVGDTTLVVTSRAADGVVRSARQPVTVRPRDPWLDDASGGLAVLGLAVVALAVGTATIVAVHHRRRDRAPSDAQASE
jgi:hypothetical protein